MGDSFHDLFALSPGPAANAGNVISSVSLFGSTAPFLRPGEPQPGAVRSRRQAGPKATAAGGAKRA
jgi:hypothetical protein